MAERDVATQLAQYLQLRYPDVIYRFDLAADLKLTPGQARRHKIMHPKRGHPDLFLAEPRAGFHGLFIEIKKDGVRLFTKTGKAASDHIAEQADMLDQLRARGYTAEFGVGFDDCKRIIDEYLA